MHALLLLAALAVPAQSAETVAPLLTDDLRFAENLARHRYFDLAMTSVAGTRRAVQALSDARDLLGETDLVEARVLKRKAQNTADPGARLEAQSAAISKLKDWTGAGSIYAYHDRLVDALEDLAEMLRERGQLHALRASEGDADAAALADEDFRGAEETYRALRGEAESLAQQFQDLEEGDRAAALRVRAANSYYFQGLNSIEWADVAADSELRLEQATKQLDDFLWDADDAQLIYYYALFEQARAYDKLGDADDARDIIEENILGLAGDMYWEYVGELPANAQQLVAAMFDKSWGYLARLDARQGDLEAGQRWIDTMLAEHKLKQVAIGRDGFAVLLEWARSLDGLGRTGPATDIVKLVADQGRGTPEGQIAEVMLTELVAGGNVQSPAVLMSAARGSFTERKFNDAAFYYIKAAALLSSPAELAEHGFDAWMGAGSSLKQLGRHLEAAVAYEQALLLEQAGRNELPNLEKAATGLYNSYERRFKDTGDSYDKSLRTAASERLIAMEGIELDLAFMTATETFGEVAADDVQGYLGVKADFEGVPKNSPNYERALVYIARCLEGAGRSDEAVRAYQAMEARADDPSLEPGNAQSRNRREIAMAQSRYYHATLLLTEQVQRPADVLVVLSGYEDDLPGQASFHELVKLRRVEAHAALGNVDLAEAELAALQAANASSSIIAAAAYRTATTLEAAARADTQPDRAKGLLARAANALWIYAEADGFSSPINVMGAGDWFLECGQAADAERVFARALDGMQRSGDSADRIERARIGLATALDVQADFGRSRTLWKDLLASNPSSVRIRRGAARCFGGWLEYDRDGNVLEIAGSGDYQDALEIWVELVKGTNVKAKYTQIWWESKLGSIYAYYRMRNLQPDAVRSASKIIQNQKLATPNYDADTMELIEEDQRYTPLFRDIFRHLDRQIGTP